MFHDERKVRQMRERMSERNQQMLGEKYKAQKC